MIGLDVRSNIREVMAEFSILKDGIKDKATVRALNRALDQVATEASREIRKIYYVTHRGVLKAMTKRRARMGSVAPQAVLEMRGKRIPLIEFDPQQTRAGVSVRIKRGGGRKTIRGAFLAAATANNWRGGGSAGMRGVWIRVGKSRYPIKNLRSITLPQMFRNEAVLAAAHRVARESFLRNFKQQIQFLARR